jgi:hypothetical protein
VKVRTVGIPVETIRRSRITEQRIVPSMWLGTQRIAVMKMIMQVEAVF